MIIEDFIMLGRTVPEASKKHGMVVCSAGYSRELRQFLRVYPLNPLERLPRWSQCRLSLRRNSEDSRQESWRLQEEQPVAVMGKAIKSDEFAALAKMASPSISFLNEQRASLGIIKPIAIRGRFDGMQPQEERIPDLFGADLGMKKRPRLLFRDADGDHDIQLRDWGSYEFLRKQPESKHYQIWSALNLDNDQYEHLLFIGNHNQHRNNWLVIGVISEKTRAQCAMNFDIAA